MWTVENTPYGPIMAAFASDEIMRAVRATGSHFFDQSTMRWFGTRNLVMVDAVVMVGTDVKAPEGYPRVWGRVFREDGGAEKVVCGTDRRKVIREAHRIAAELKAGTSSGETVEV